MKFNVSVFKSSICLVMVVMVAFFALAGKFAHACSCTIVLPEKFAMDDDLICNFKKCRKRLNTVAWVTSCSRILNQQMY